MVIWLAVLVLRRYRSVLAIYLCRGCAKSDITPGISDIDLVIVTTNDSQEKRSIEGAFRALGILTARLIDYYPNLVKTRATLEHRWRTAPAWQYRYHEGRTTWRLLFGADVLSSLPPLTERQRVSSCYAEMNRWWLLFADQLLKTGKYHHDPIMRNVICYKAVSEILNTDWAMRTGEYRRSRQEGLECSNSLLARKLGAISGQRFLTSDDQLMDETLNFLLRFFSSLGNSFSERPFLPVLPKRSQTVDCPLSEMHVDKSAAEQVQALNEHLRTHWGVKCLSTHTVKSAFWDLEDLLLIIDIDENSLPTVREIADLSIMQVQAQKRLSQQIFLFLRLGSVALPITPLIPRDLHRGILTPATMPDVFLQLGDSSVCWTDYAQWYLSDWQSNEQWLDASALKQQQLMAIARSIESRQIIYPLTLPALERATQRIADRQEMRTLADVLH